MPSLKEICTLLLAGGVGAGSVVAVQEVRPRPKAEKRTAAKPRPAVAAASRPALNDCPVLGGALVPEFNASLPPSGDPGVSSFPSVAGHGLWVPGGAGGGGSLLPPRPGGPTIVVPPTPPPSAPIPEPAAWAMMISGFGLVGVAARLRPLRA